MIKHKLINLRYLSSLFLKGPFTDYWTIETLYFQRSPVSVDKFTTIHDIIAKKMCGFKENKYIIKLAILIFFVCFE